MLMCSNPPCCSLIRIFVSFSFFFLDVFWCTVFELFYYLLLLLLLLLLKSKPLKLPQFFTSSLIFFFFKNLDSFSLIKSTLQAQSKLQSLLYIYIYIYILFNNRMFSGAAAYCFELSKECFLFCLSSSS